MSQFIYSSKIYTKTELRKIFFSYKTMQFTSLNDQLIAQILTKVSPRTLIIFFKLSTRYYGLYNSKYFWKNAIALEFPDENIEPGTNNLNFHREKYATIKYIKLKNNKVHLTNSDPYKKIQQNINDTEDQIKRLQQVLIMRHAQCQLINKVENERISGSKFHLLLTPKNIPIPETFKIGFGSMAELVATETKINKMAAENKDLPENITEKYLTLVQTRWIFLILSHIELHEGVLIILYGGDYYSAPRVFYVTYVNTNFYFIFFPTIGQNFNDFLLSKYPTKNYQEIMAMYGNPFA